MALNEEGMIFGVACASSIVALVMFFACVQESGHIGNLMRGVNALSSKRNSEGV